MTEHVGLNLGQMPDIEATKSWNIGKQLTPQQRMQAVELGNPVGLDKKPPSVITRPKGIHGVALGGSHADTVKSSL